MNYTRITFNARSTRDNESYKVLTFVTNNIVMKSMMKLFLLHLVMKFF